MNWFFARRYLFSSESRSVVNLIAGLSVAAVAMPVAAMIILLSVFNGFESLVRSMGTVFDADLTLTPRAGKVFRTDALDTAALGALPRIEACSFVLEQRALVEYAGRQATATVRGVDDAYYDVLPLDVAPDPRVRIGDLERLVIGQAMRYTLGIRSLADAEVNLYAVRRGRFSSLLPVENYVRQRVPVGGTFLVDLDTEQTYLLASLRLARRLFGHDDGATALLLRLKPDSDAEAARQAVARIAGPDFRVRTREELQGSLYRIMAYEKWGIFCIALLVLVVASFSVVGALAMLIVEKRRDAATLRALGASTALLRSIFRSEGLLICSLGAGAGIVLGVGASLVQQHFGLIEIPAESFLVKSYPVEFRPGDLAAVVVSFGAVAWLLTGLTVRNMIDKKSRTTRQ